jgi:hypothetical protein
MNIQHPTSNIRLRAESRPAPSAFGVRRSMFDVSALRLFLFTAFLTAFALLAASPPAVELPPRPVVHSPVGFFRELLAMKPEARLQALTNRSDKSRQVILSKLSEYAALRPEDRELRLQAMHLRWLLLPMMQGSPAERSVQLANLSASDRALIEPRLQRWDQIPADLQKQFLEHETAIDYFMRVQHSPQPPLPPGLSVPMDHQRRRLDERLARWEGLAEEERHRMIGQFRGFFELEPRELAKTMTKLGDSERQLMEKTLERFSSLPPEQRRECVLAFERLAQMKPSDRTQFFRNVEKWEAMSPQERQAWRDLVRRVPQLPPFPPGFFPPMPVVSKAVANSP